MDTAYLYSKKALIDVIAIAFLTLTLSNCGSSSGTPVFDSGTRQLMQTSLDSCVSEIGVPGATMTIERPDGAKWVGVSGFANLENQIPMSSDLKFRVASVTKTFTATVILQLVQEGRFSLDDSVESILPGLIPNGTQISIRRLLNHTSGIFDYVQALNPNFLLGVTQNRLRKWTPGELVAVANANQVYFAPGGGWHYSNTNYVLLGMIIEKVTGNTYAREINSRILSPLGLKNTTVLEVADMPVGSTQGYWYVPPDWINTTMLDLSWMFATANIVSNSEDLLVWLKALMAGSLLDQQRKMDMFSFVNQATPDNHKYYGLGLENQNGVIGHTGDLVFGGQAAVYEYNGWKFIVLINASPSKDIQPWGFGSELILFKTMAALGLITL
jgi:D-alanyl-D-alanine carboxypeptidase